MPKTKKRKINHHPNLDKICDEDSESIVKANLNCLPDIPVLHIAAHLEPEDLLSFSISCKNVFDICDYDRKIWVRALKRQSYDHWHDFKLMAATIVDKQIIFSTNNVDKLSFLMFRKTKQNWSTGESVRISEFTHRDKYAAYFDNQSSHFLSMMDKVRIENNVCSLKFRLWNINTSKDVDFKIEGGMPRNKEHPELHIFNDLILAEFPVKNVNGCDCDKISCYGLNVPEQEDLKLLWQNEHAYDGKTIWCKSVSRDFYVIFVLLAKGEFLIDGFSMKDGAKVFSHTLKTATYFRPIITAWNDEGWFVADLPGLLVAINYYTNALAVLDDDTFGLINAITAKGDLAMCLLDDGIVDLYHLPTGKRLPVPDIDITNRELFSVYSLKLAADFDPVAKVVCGVYENPDDYSLVYKLFHWSSSPVDADAKTRITSPTIILESLFNCNVNIQDLRLLLGNVVRLELVKQNPKIYRLRITNQTGNIKFRHHAIGNKATIHKINPFFVAVHDKNYFIVYDFLNIAQYFK